MQENRVSIIVFSKDRPLQLQSYLESLFFFSDLPQSCITVLYTSTENISYQKLVERFSEVNWNREDSFFDDLLRAVHLANDFVMFGCDDVVFRDYIDFSFATGILDDQEDIFGFSLRLGLNIKKVPTHSKVFDSHIEWNWSSPVNNDWSYPWEVTATIYRKPDVGKIMSVLDSEKTKNPNFFEAQIADRRTEFITKSGLASFKKSKCILLTINRVQDDYVNGYDDTLSTDIESLYKLFENGFKIDFMWIARKKTKSFTVGAEFFKLSGTEKLSTTIFRILKIYLRKALVLTKRIRGKLGI